MQLEPVRMIWSKYEESETGNTAVGFGINGPLGVGTCVPGFACRSEFEWEKGCWDGETEFIVKLYCSWVTTPTPLFSTYNTKLRVSPIFQVYHEGENQTLPWLIRTRLNGYLIKKKKISCVVLGVRLCLCNLCCYGISHWSFIWNIFTIQNETVNFFPISPGFDVKLRIFVAL